MALSFEDSLKAAQAESEDATAMAATASVMSLESYDVAADEGIAVAAYSGDDGSWTQHAGYDWYTGVDGVAGSLGYDDDDMSNIDAMKNVSLNSKQFNINQEHKSQFIPFEMPRYYDGYDLTKATIGINYRRKDGDVRTKKAVNVRYNNEKIQFGWLVESHATEVTGKLEFEIVAFGTDYIWKSRMVDKMNVLESIPFSDELISIESDDTWVSEIVEAVTEQIVGMEFNEQLASANEAVTRAETAAANAESAATTAVKAELSNYATIEYVDSIDVSDQLTEYAKTAEVESKLSDYAKLDELSEDIASEYAKTEYVDEKIGNLTLPVTNDDSGVATVAEDDNVYDNVTDFVIAAMDSVDVSDELSDYYKKSETYTKEEVDTAVSNVTVDLTGYATETYVDNKADALSSSVATNATNITSLNSAVTTINQTLEGIDKSPRVTYDATYGDVELDDGTTAEYMFTLWKTESGVREVQDRFQILGGGGSSGSSVVLRIAYVEGYTTPLVATVNDPVIVKYEFSGEDSAGDTNLDGTASWKVGNRVVATEDVSTGECEFDLTDYVSVGDNKVVLTITHATGAVATKAWTVKVVDVRLESTFDDTKTYAAGSPVTFTFTPYGSVAKTVHFLLDGEEIDTKTSVASASGLSDSYSIPAQEHGTHLFEIYMTAEINGKTVESNHIVNDIIWYDENSDVPVISTVQQTFTARQYEATNIEYTVYDPSTETPSVSLKATYVNKDGETVEEYSSNITMSSNTATWQYKTDVIGEHILTITCGETVKTLVATIVELGINVTPITAGLAFDFNPVGYSNDDENRLWSYGDVAMTVSDNFDWVNGGYQIDENGDQCFCIKAGTSAEIDYQLFGDDAKSNGKQFKLIFKTENVASTDAMFLSCVSDPTDTGKIGIEMLAHEATIYAKTESLPLPYAEEEIIEFEFNITPSSETPSMVMGYEDGVSTRPLVYDATHDFQQQIGYRETISLGSDDCDLYIYRFKVYNTSLSDRDILNNFIADARSAEEMIDRYDRNQIYKEGVLDPDYLAEACPDLRIIKLEVPHFTKDKDDKVYDASIQSIVECIYKNGDPIYDNWVAYDIVHSGQGTSSNNYGPAGRNLDIIIKSYKDYGNAPYIILGDGSQVSKVSLTRESVPVNYFNVKVNIASSENANNALLQKRYNQYNPYKRPFVRDTDEEAAMVKDTMEFQNCVVFLKESDPDTSTHIEFADCEWHFYAIGNIGDSKKTDSSRLTDPDDQYECIIEVMDNTMPLSTMPTGYTNEDGSPRYPITVEEWETMDNQAYNALYYEQFDEESGFNKDGSLNKPNGLDDTYGMRYVWEDGSDEENEAAWDYVKNQWKDFYKFVVTSTDEEFKANLGDWCALDSVLYYYLFTLRYTMTDNHAKNSFWHYGKTGEVDTDGNPIRKWDLCFDYDNDTALGIDNYGRMTYRYGYEEIDYVDGTEDWVWNAPQHVFFLRLRELFDDELCELYTELESMGAWSATSLINQFNDWQMQFPEELWRVDIQRKYIRTYTTSYINGKAYPEFLTERANGRKKTQRAQFEKNQEKYMSSKFGGTVASNDDVVLRCSVPNTTLAVTPNFDMHLTPYSYVYLNVKYNTAPPVKIRAVPNTEYTIPYTSELADIIEIYSASCLKSVGDLSACYLINGNFAQATKLRELILGSSVEGYENTNSMTLGLGSNELLTKLDIQNMSGLTSSLDVSGLKNLEELYAFGSNVSGVIFADGGNIEIAEIPSVGSLQMKNLNYLTDDGFEATSYSKLTRLVAENSLLDLIELIDNAPNLYQVRLTGIDWRLEDTTLLERLYGLAGVTNTGANSDQSVLAGKVYAPVIRQQQLAEYNEAWPDLEISYGTMIEQYPVTFVNDDGTVLEVQYVDRTSYAVDPVTREDNPIPVPTKESTVSTDYTYAGWDTDLSSLVIREAVTVTAVYTESTREYTIKYVSNGVTLQETTAAYGTNVIYEGSVPTYTAEEASEHFYLFNRWDKSGFIDGDKTVNAVFDDFRYSTGYFADKEIGNLTPVEIYALTKLGLDNVDHSIDAGDDYSFTMGYDVDYDDIESELIVSEKMSFTGSNYYDTGIKLFEEDKDFVLAIDYKMSSSSSANSVLAQCFQSNGSNGFKLSYNSGVKFAWGTSSITPASADNREMIVIRHVKGSSTITVYNSNIGSTSISTSELTSTRNPTISETLVFGALQPEEGSYENNGVGNIYWSKIWYKDLGDEACRELVGWTHEEISLEVCSFKKYYLTDNPSKRCSFSLLATHLLDRARYYNSSQTTVGGWASSNLNSFLNSRFYNAIPAQIKALLKQVTVTSTIGGGSLEVSSSECYVYVPAISELSNAKTVFTQEPYTSEGTIISYMTSNEMRKRAYVDGEYANYWTRSPNYSATNGYTNYIYQIDSSGADYGFVYANNTAGILIEISF